MRGESRAIGLDQKATDAPILWSNARFFNFRPNHSDVCNAARRNPHLFAIQNVLVAVFEIGTRTSCMARPDVTDARNDHLPCTSCAENPGRSVSTRKPRMRQFSGATPGSSTFAQITATSAMLPDVIHIFSPFRTYSSPSLRSEHAHPAWRDRT